MFVLVYIVCVLLLLWMSIMAQDVLCKEMMVIPRQRSCVNLGESQKTLLVSLGIVLAGFMQRMWFSWSISPKCSSYSRLMVYCQSSLGQRGMLLFAACWSGKWRTEIHDCLGYSATVRDGLFVWVVSPTLFAHPWETCSLRVHTSGKKYSPE